MSSLISKLKNCKKSIDENNRRIKRKMDEYVDFRKNRRVYQKIKALTRNYVRHNLGEYQKFYTTLNQVLVGKDIRHKSLTDKDLIKIKTIDERVVISLDLL